jgi:hypothetical protein
VELCHNALKPIFDSLEANWTLFTL